MSKSNKSNKSNFAVAVVDAVSAVVPGLQENDVLIALDTTAVETATQPVVVASEIQLTPAAAMSALCPPAQRKARQSKPGRPYYAAQVLRSNGGLDAVINDELADKVDLACGKPNRTESLAWLKIALQICKGWETKAK